MNFIFDLPIIYMIFSGFQGVDIFAAKINLVVQWANETAIAAGERVGGIIRTVYYNPISLMAAVNPKAWFEMRYSIVFDCDLP